MDSFKWTTDNPVEKVWAADNINELGSDYLRLVLSNMDGDLSAQVRFDRQLSEYRPIYQILYSSGVKVLFDGANHDEYSPVAVMHLPEFSQIFTYQHIQATYQLLQDEHLHRD